MHYNCKFSQKNRLQINCSNHSTNHLLRNTTTSNHKTDSFTKPHKKWASWRRTLYCHFCDLTKISNKRSCIQRYMENKQVTVDFSSSILMNSRKCFTNDVHNKSHSKWIILSKQRSTYFYDFTVTSQECRSTLTYIKNPPMTRKFSSTIFPSSRN